nr:MAG TPA: hypothetical protein [Caudoviricetes sp.]
MYEFDMTKNRAAYKAHLDDIGVQTLPDQPGKRGFTAEEVKLHFKAPIDFLFALIGKNLNEMTSVLAKYDLTIEEAKKEIKELQTAIAKGVLFSPALQGTAPDPTQVKVWIDTSENEETQEEIPKEDASSEIEGESLEDATSKEVVADFNPDDGSLSFANVNEQSEETKFTNVNGSAIEVAFANVNENGNEQTNFASVNEEPEETFSNVNETEETMFKNVNESNADELKLGE